MYHLPEPEKVYNKAFVEKFAKENEVTIRTHPGLEAEPSQTQARKFG
jgi:hypothetical protein